MSIDLNDPTVDEKLRRAFVEGWCESSPAGYDSLRAILADAESPHEEQRLPPAALREVIACGISDEGVQELFRDLLVSPQRNGIAAWLRVALHGDDADACAGAASICLLSAELRGEFLVDLAAATNSPSWAARREVLEVLAADQSGDERIKSLVDHALAVQPPDVAIAVASQRYRDGDRRPAIVELIVRGLRSPDPDVCGCGCFAIAQHADPIIPVAELFEIMRRPDLHVAQPMFVLHHLQARRDPEATRLAVLDLESDRYERHLHAALAILRTRLRLDRTVVDALLRRSRDQDIYESRAASADDEQQRRAWRETPAVIEAALAAIAGFADQDLAPLVRKAAIEDGDLRAVESVVRLKLRDEATLEGLRKVGRLYESCPEGSAAIAQALSALESLAD